MNTENSFFIKPPYLLAIMMMNIDYIILSNFASSEDCQKEMPQRCRIKSWISQTDDNGKDLLVVGQKKIPAFAGILKRRENLL